MRINIILSFLLLLINYKLFYFILLDKENILLLFYELIVYYIIFIFLISLFSFSKWLSRLWITILLFISLIEVYFINKMGIEINKQIIKNIVATTQNETLELLGNEFYYYFVICLIAVCLLYKFIISKINRLSLFKYFFSLIVLMGMFFGLTKIDNTIYRKFIKHDTSKVVPINIFPALERYFNTRAREEKIVKKNISNMFTYKSNTKKPLISVMIIGESARGDRFGINGYKKNTTPNLEKEQNTISFNNATSCDTSTLSSVPCMIMRFKSGEFNFPIVENSFVQVFTDFGFDTHWITLQDEAKVIKTFCQEANSCVDMKDVKYDLDVYDNFKMIVQNATKNTLIVLHIMGSHYNYNERVPKQYQKFQPIYTDDYTKNKEKLDNSYDNSILYTDIFLGKLIDVLKNKNSFLLYSSDHGESLGEKQYGIFAKYGHAAPIKVAPKEQLSVPFVLWYSNDFKQNNPQIISVKKYNKKIISHDNIFSTMLGCAGFEGDYVEDKLNICSDKF